MARNEIHIEVPPDAVFAVLADPRTYAEWVVGSREIRAADRRWPASGATFDHSVGLPPLVIKDATTVIQASPPVILELLVRARPLPSMRVTLHLQPERSGTRVTMIEEPVSGLLNVLAGPAGHAALRIRNAESLRRLKRLAEKPATRPGGRLPQRPKARSGVT